MSNNLTEDEKGQVARIVMSILDGWGLDAEQQRNMLDLPENVPGRALRRYRDGAPFPDDDNVMKRVEHIVGIAEALRTTYPHNASMANLWMKRTNKHFPRRPPLLIMIEDGLTGLLQVRAHLDCTFDWFNA